MRNLLIQGVESLLGSYFAARCLQVLNYRVFYLGEAPESLSKEEVTDFVAHAAGQIGEGEQHSDIQKAIANRLHWGGRNLNVPAPGRVVSAIDEVWYFANSGKTERQSDAPQDLISACPAIGAKEFNYVAVDNDGMKLEGGFSDHEIAQRCKEANIHYRIFRTSLIVGKGHPGLKPGGAAFLQFLSALHSLKSEIEERSPQYFDFQALRYLAPKDAALNLIPAGIATELLFRIAQNSETMDSSFTIVHPQNTPFSAVCERVGIAYGISLIAVEEFNALNAIDRVLDEQSGDFHGYVMGGAPGSPNTEAFQIAALPVEEMSFDEDAQITLFDSLRQDHDEARAASCQRVNDMADESAAKTIIRDGSELTYYVAGAGDVIVLLNALGQGMECWRRLICKLIESYRVIFWEPRGTIAPPPPFGVTDQVDDLDAILRHEKIEICHLVGWCTGPKVAIEFYFRSPEMVRSMAFLNGTFKCQGSEEELDSPYEKNLESLCRMLVRKPAMAASVRKTFQARVDESEIDLLNGSDAEQISVSVLSQMNGALKSHVLAPFKTAETTLNYAHQLLDFWSVDSRRKASEVRVPVLLMETEYDQVATPAMSQMAAGLFPNARHVHVRGATHYCLHDRPEFVANLLRTFFENPEDLPGAERLHMEAAQTY